jgi:hypothetical protein
MSYCNPKWISLYHYLPLLEHPLLDPRLVADPGDRPPYFDEVDFDPVPRHLPDPVPRWLGPRVSLLTEPEAEPLIVLSGLIEHDRVEVRSVLRLQTGPTAAGLRLAGVVAELLDESGVVLERAAVRRVTTYASCGCGAIGEGEGDVPSGIIQALLHDPGRGVTLRIMRDDEELWSRRAPSEPPAVDEVSAALEGDQVLVRWRAELADDQAVERFVRWSADNGASWQALATFLANDEATVAVDSMTSGSALIQVMVSDGFYTTVSGPVRLEVPPRPPQVAILSPTDGGVSRAGAPVRLWGAATASDGRWLPDEALEWELDGEEVGTGPEVWTELGAWEGEHRCRLRASDDDRRAEATVTFVATGSGGRPRRAS